MLGWRAGSCNGAGRRRPGNGVTRSGDSCRAGGGRRALARVGPSSGAEHETRSGPPAGGSGVSAADGGSHPPASVLQGMKHHGAHHPGVARCDASAHAQAAFPPTPLCQRISMYLWEDYLQPEGMNRRGRAAGRSLDFFCKNRCVLRIGRSIPCGDRTSALERGLQRGQSSSCSGSQRGSVWTAVPQWASRRRAASSRSSAATASRIPRCSSMACADSSGARWNACS